MISSSSTGSGFERREPVYRARPARATIAPVSPAKLAVAGSTLVLITLACSGENRQAVPPPDSGAVTTAASSGAAVLPSVLRQPRLGDIDSMRQRRYIRVLVPPNRTYFFYDGLRERGTTVEFLREFEIWLNQRFRTERTPTAVVFVPASRETFLTDLVNGRGDVAAGGIAVTERRQRALDFTIPIGTSALVVVTAPGAPPLRDLADLSGHEVYIRGGSHYAEEVARLNGLFAMEGRPGIRIRPANRDLEDEDILELVNTGVVPITVVDRHLARFWKDVLDSLTVREDLVVADSQTYAFAVRKDSPQLRALLDEFLRSHRQGTSFGNTVLRRYLESNPWVKSPHATAERRRVEATIGFFRRYARQYDLDYLLLMAQGYQESQLRQDLRSPAGAVGVMQLLPTTAAAPPIRIPDVASNAGNNILAGARYMRHLQDVYFRDPALTPFNRQVFALAGYNAGPNRIATLRRMARAEGLNGDVWFQNVELIAGREIGRETTTYVRNILKYYVTYQLTLDSTSR